MAIRFLSGETIDGDATFSGHITLASDKKVNFGASSYIEGATSGSKLMFRSSDDMIFQPGSSTKVTFQANGNATFEGNVTLAATKKLQYADDKIIIGNTNSTLGNEAISLGYDADSTGNQSIGIGYNPEASGTYSVAIGYNVTASGTSTFVFGTSGSHSDNNTLVASGLDLKVTGTGTSTFAGNVSGVTASFGSGTSRFTDTSAYPLQLNRGLAVDTVGAAGVILGLGSYSTGTTYVDAVRIVGVLEGNGTNGDMQLQVLNSGSYTNALTLNNNNDATFAGDVTINGTITLGTASFVGTVAGQTVVSSEGAYASSGSVKLYEAKRSGGAVGGDWSYDDATTDMSLGTNTNHAFSLKTNNTRALTITNSQNVGIGLTSPASVLHIKDNTAGATQLSIQSNDFTRAEEINFLNPSTSAISGQIKYYTNPTVEYMSFSISNNSAATERMRITGAGNVGIGTSSPIQKLDTPNIVIGGSTIAGTYRANALFMDNNGGNSRFYSSGADASTKGSYEFNIMASDANPLETPLVISNIGNIGIGTTSPGTKLDIVGTSSGSITNLMKIQNPVNSAGTGHGSSLILHSTTDSNRGVAIASSSATNYATNNNMLFYTSSSSTLYERMRIDSNGQVGIGTTSPAEKLDVAGKVQVTGTSLTIINASDPVVTVSDTDTNYRGSMRWLSSSNVLEFFTRYAGTYYTNNLVLDRGNVGIGTTAIPTNGYTASGGGWKMLQIGQSSQIAAYGTDDEIGIFQNTYLNTSGVFQAITSDVAGSSIILVDGKIYFKNASTSGTTQTTSTRMFINTDGNVGMGTTSPVARVDSLSDDGLNKSNNGVKTGRMQYSWYMGKSFTNNDAYVHIKTNLWMGGSPAGNTQYIMGGFTAKSYGYGDGYGEGSCMFHNWNGGFPNLNVTNRGGWATFMQNPYTSTDGYCVIVLRHDYYSTPIIDFQQSYTGYPWRQVTVTATSTSANATGVY